ncbi:hypothetical protein ACFQU2_15435 [Siccirubricoccus deserti]
MTDISVDFSATALSLVLTTTLEGPIWNAAPSRLRYSPRPGCSASSARR